MLLHPDARRIGSAGFGPKPFCRRVVAVAGGVCGLSAAGVEIVDPPVQGPSDRRFAAWHLGAVRSRQPHSPGRSSSRPAAGPRAGPRMATGLVGNSAASGVGSRQASGSAPGELLLRPGGSKDPASDRPADWRVSMPEQSLPRVMCGPVDLRFRRWRATRCICGLPEGSKDPRGVFSDTARGHRCRLDRLILFRALSGVYSWKQRVGLNLSTPQGCASCPSRARGFSGIIFGSPQLRWTSRWTGWGGGVEGFAGAEAAPAAPTRVLTGPAPPRGATGAR